MSCDILDEVSDTISRLDESENIDIISPRTVDIVDVSDQNEDDKSSLIGDDGGSLQVNTVTCEEHEETRYISAVKASPQVIEDPSAHVTAKRIVETTKLIETTLILFNC